jgi:hypothetical protein
MEAGRPASDTHTTVGRSWSDSPGPPKRSSNKTSGYLVSAIDESAAGFSTRDRNAIDRFLAKTADAMAELVRKEQALGASPDVAAESMRPAQLRKLVATVEGITLLQPWQLARCDGIRIA